MKKAKNARIKALYESILGSLSGSGKICGFDLLDPDWQWNRWSTMTLFLLLIFASSFCYYVPKFSNDFAILCSCFSSIGITILGFYKIFTWTRNRDVLRAMCASAVEKNLTYEDDSEAGKVILKYGDWMHRTMKALKWVLVFLSTFCDLEPFVYYLIFRKKVLQLMAPIPGLNFETHPGYELNYLYLCLASIFIIDFFVYSHTVQMFLFFSMSTQVKILQTKTRAFGAFVASEMTSLLTQPPVPRVLHAEERFTPRLTELIEEHQKLLEFIGEGEDFFWFQFLLDSGCFSVQSIISLFSATEEGYIPGYLILGSTVFLMFTNCVLVAFVEEKMEELVEEIYEVPWYDFPTRTRKTFRLFLMRAQDTKQFSCGKVYPMGMEMFSSFCNSIYTYYLILLDLAAKAQ